MNKKQADNAIKDIASPVPKEKKTWKNGSPKMNIAKALIDGGMEPVKAAKLAGYKSPSIISNVKQMSITSSKRVKAASSVLDLALETALSGDIDDRKLGVQVSKMIYDRLEPIVTVPAAPPSQSFIQINVNNITEALRMIAEASGQK